MLFLLERRSEKLKFKMRESKKGWSWWPAIALLLVVAVFIVFFIVANYYNMFNENYVSNNDSSDNSSFDSELIEQQEACVELGCEEGNLYIGSVNSDKYYSCLCGWGKSISEENRVCFESDSSALADGRVKSEC